MNAHYQQFVSCFLENLFLAKTSKLEITAAGVSAVIINYDVFISLTYVQTEGLYFIGDYSQFDRYQ